MIKLVLTDLDDTLIPFGARCATKKTLAAIHDHQDAGVHFAPCSGRPAAFLDGLFDGDGRAWSTAVLVNGQEVRLDGRIAFEKTLSRQELAELADFARTFENTGLVVMVDGQEVAIGVSEETVAAHPDVFVSNPPVLPELPAGDQIKAIIYVYGGRTQVEHVCARCRERFPLFDFALPTAGEPVIDVLPKGWSKAAGANKLCELLGIAREEVCVFGDAANDLPIFAEYPHSVAVGNAEPDVLAAARYRIGTCADDAVAEALLQIAKAARTGGTPAFMEEEA